MTKPRSQKKKRVKIALDYTADVELLNMPELLDTLNQYGRVEITDIAIFEEEVAEYDRDIGEY